MQTNSVEVKYGRLTLNRLQTKLDKEAVLGDVKAFVNGESVKATARSSEGYVEVLLGELQLKAGDKLEVVFSRGV